MKLIEMAYPRVNSTLSLKAPFVSPLIVTPSFEIQDSVHFGMPKKGKNKYGMPSESSGGQEEMRQRNEEILEGEPDASTPEKDEVRKTAEQMGQKRYNAWQMVENEQSEGGFGTESGRSRRRQ